MTTTAGALTAVVDAVVTQDLRALSVAQPQQAVSLAVDREYDPAYEAR